MAFKIALWKNVDELAIIASNSTTTFLEVHHLSISLFCQCDLTSTHFAAIKCVLTHEIILKNQKKELQKGPLEDVK